MLARIHSQTLLRAARAAAALSLLLALAAPAGAARVTDVRVGLHSSFTRVVFETDTPTRYRIERGPGDEIQIHLGASAMPRRISTRSKLVSEVRVVPGSQGATGRLSLRGQDVKISELILLNPPRIVLDLRAGGASLASKKPAPAPAPKTAAKPAPKPVAKTVAEPAPKPAPTTTAKAEAKPAPPPAPTQAAEPTKPAEKPGVTLSKLAEAAAAQKRPEAAGAQKRLAEAAAEAQAKAAESARAGAEGLAAQAGEAKEEVAATAEAAAAAAAEQARKRASEAAAKRAEAAAEARRKAAELARRAKPEPTPEAADTSPLPAFLRDPVVLGGIGVAIALAIGILVHHRRSGREDDYLSPTAADDEPFSLDEGVSADAAPEFEATAPTAAEAPPLGAYDHDTSREDEEAAAVDTGMDTPVETTGYAAMPGAGASADVMSMMQEMERRITGLEKRIEEVTEAKERLERQVAAQTEELRVQRSAIARTQRALRSIARPEDEATEPVPKT